MIELDAHDRKIIALLQQNARMPFTQIGRRVHLTSPAVAERVHRLETAGVIQGYAARINFRAMGYSFEAFVQVSVASIVDLENWVDLHDEVIELHYITGEHCAALRIGLVSTEHLEALLATLSQLGKTSTSIVLRSRFEGRPRKPADRVNGARDQMHRPDVDIGKR